MPISSNLSGSSSTGVGQSDISDTMQISSTMETYATSEYFQWRGFMCIISMVTMMINVDEVVSTSTARVIYSPDFIIHLRVFM